MANIKHLAIDLAIAAAVAAAMGWSASLPLPQSRHMTADETMSDTMVLKSSVLRYSKFPQTGKPQRSTLKS